MSSWRGQLDVVDRERISGWAQDGTQPDRPVVLRIRDNGAVLAEISADGYREDLASAGIGAGRHAFSFTVPGGLAPELRHLIQVERAVDGEALPGSPRVVEAVADTFVTVREAAPATWHGKLETVTRERIEGWAWDEASAAPVALVIVCNGEVIARVLANRYRDDLQRAGIGDGRHAFSALIPGGLSALSRHVIQVLGEVDGRDIEGSPHILESAHSFDAALEHTVSTAVAALASPADRERALTFFATQVDTLLQAGADAAAGREARLIQRWYERRWGKAATAADGAGRARPRALVIDDLAPVLGRDAGSTAILSHMRALSTLGYALTLVAADELAPDPVTLGDLANLGIECCPSPYYASVEEVLRRQREGFELVYLHRVSNAAKYLALAHDYCPKARLVYSVADLHHVRVARQAKVEGRPELLELSRRLRLAECMAACNAHVVITHSAVEADVLKQAVTGCNVHVVPWAVPPTPTSRPWAERAGVAFVANFGHAPNVDAAHFLALNILPRVREANPAIDCIFAGSRMPESVQRLAGPGIEVWGHVPDLARVYERVRLVAAPLRFGAGIKGKVLEAFAAGVPCVLSPIAAEGLALPAPLVGAIGADAAELAARIVRLHSNEAECQALAQAGLKYIEAGYTEAAVVAALKAALEGRRASAGAGEELRGGSAKIPVA